LGSAGGAADLSGSSLLPMVVHSNSMARMPAEQGEAPAGPQQTQQQQQQQHAGFLVCGLSDSEVAVCAFCLCRFVRRGRVCMLLLTNCQTLKWPCV
jgi:hypothetical protein